MQPERTYACTEKRNGATELSLVASDSGCKWWLVGLRPPMLGAPLCNARADVALHLIAGIAPLCVKAFVAVVVVCVVF
jgi:hypothetical protein